MPLGPSLPDELGISERDEEILRLHLRGRKQKDIGEQYGITQQAVSKVIRETIKKIPEETLEEARRLDLQRIDEFLQIASDRYVAGDDKEGRLATDLLKHRADVFGYKAPAKQQIEHSGKVNYHIDGVDMAKVLGEKEL